ncbi:sodium-coupled neutral amino acid symporter 1-like [Heptranchias perlo]|uniref:sodium-coupled neutral amino acid symporter 1-like n=1 Tax=Heptranchias perlo TaxID=212740 RepID=UPI00355A92D1
MANLEFKTSNNSAENVDCERTDFTVSEGGMNRKCGHDEDFESTECRTTNHVENHSGSTSFEMSVFNLSNAIIGSGLLGLSYAMANTGIVPFMFLLISVTLMSLYSIHLLLQISVVTDSVVYETLGQLAFGKPGKFTVFGSTSLQNTGAILSYLFIVKNELPHVIKSFIVQENFDEWYVSGDILVVFVTLIIILPLCLFKNLGYLGYTSGFSLVCMIFFLIVVMYKKTQLPCPLVLTNSSNFSCTTMCKPKSFVWNNKTVYALPTVAFAFVCHPSVLPIYSELKKRTCRNMQVVSMISFTSMFIMYLLTALFGYLTFYGSVKEELLSSYPVDGDKIILLVRLAVIIAVILTVPVLLFTVRSSIILLLYKGKFSWPRHLTITCLLLVASNVLVIYIPSIKDVFAVIGSTSANMLIFILPASIYLKLVTNESQSSWQKILVMAFLTVGIMFMLITVPLIFVEWNQRSHNNTITDSCSGVTLTPITG